MKGDPEDPSSNVERETLLPLPRYCLKACSLWPLPRPWLEFFFRRFDPRTPE